MYILAEEPGVASGKKVWKKVKCSQCKYSTKSIEYNVNM